MGKLIPGEKFISEIFWQSIEK